jgi:hypothetical protein
METEGPWIYQINVIQQVPEKVFRSSSVSTTKRNLGLNQILLDSLGLLFIQPAAYSTATMLLKNLVVAIVTPIALAADPIGGGNWKRVYPSSSIQECAGGNVNGASFELPSKPNGSTSGSGCSNGHLRAEERLKNDYSSGVHQFGGKFKITSFGGDRVSLKQTFNGNDGGPWFMMAVEQSGRLYNVEDQETIAEGVAKVGATVQVNTVHDIEAGEFTVYINGKERYSTSSPGGSFYDKYGAYTTNSGSGPIKVTWSDVAFWTR